MLAKLDTDANPRIAQAFGIQGIPAVKAFKDGRVVDEFVGAQPPASVERFFDGLVPERGRRARRPTATRRRCAARSSSSPAAPTPPSRWRACCTAAASADEALALLANVSGSFAADGLAARMRLEQADDLDLDEAFEALDEGDTERAVDLLIEALSSADGHKDDVRRVVVGALDELGVDHPLARDARRRLAGRSVLAAQNVRAHERRAALGLLPPEHVPDALEQLEARVAGSRGR